MFIKEMVLHSSLIIAKALSNITVYAVMFDNADAIKFKFSVIPLPGNMRREK